MLNSGLQVGWAANRVSATAPSTSPIAATATMARCPGVKPASRLFARSREATVRRFTAGILMISLKASSALLRTVVVSWVASWAWVAAIT